MRWDRRVHLLFVNCSSIMIFFSYCLFPICQCTKLACKSQTWREFFCWRKMPWYYCLFSLKLRWLKTLKYNFLYFLHVATTLLRLFKNSVIFGHQTVETKTLGLEGYRYCLSDCTELWWLPWLPLLIFSITPLWQQKEWVYFGPTQTQMQILNQLDENDDTSSIIFHYADIGILKKKKKATL